MGDANITRDQFSEFKANGSTVLHKYMQQGTYIADSDFNEVGQISSQRAARHLWNLIKRQNVRFSAGWNITGGSNQVTVSAGDAALLVNIKRAGTSLLTVADSDKAYIFHLTSNTNVTCPTQTTTRTDCLYLDITLPIIDSVDDATLVNPAIGKETSVDQRLTFAFAKREGYSVPPTAPSGHYYVAIATIARTASATIADGSITNLLYHYADIVDLSVTTEKINASAVTTAKMLDDTVTAAKMANGILCYPIYADSANIATVNVDAAARPEYIGAPSSRVKIRTSAFKLAGFNTIRARMEYYQSGYVSPYHSHLALTVNGAVSANSSVHVSGNIAWGTWISLSYDCSAIADNTDLEICIGMDLQTGATFIIRHVTIWASYD